MRQRPTSRVVLIDPKSRILLMRFRDPHEDGPFWATIGGGAKPGETPAEAASREAFEETGLLDIALGPIVWYGEVKLKGHDGNPVLLQESYVVARTNGGALNRDGWEELERKWVEDMRWWSFEEIASSTETIYPQGLAELLPPILAGIYPREPIIITRPGDVE